MKHDFQIIAIHILPDCSDHIRKVLNKDGWFFFNRKYKEKNGKLVINNSYSVPENFYSNKINVQAIVGKNGSGKSSVIEVMLRLINNLAYNLISNANTDTKLHFVKDLNAELFYEINGAINFLKCTNNMVYLNQGNGYDTSVDEYIDINKAANKFNLGEHPSLNVAIPLLQRIFFTIVNNYSFHAYNAFDYIEENETRDHVWLDGVFHKNDGYLTPLVLNPYRDFGKIDIESEKNLTNIRLASLFYRLKKEKIDFIPDYEYQYLTFNFDKSYVNSKYITKNKLDRSKMGPEILVSVQNTKVDIFNTTLKCYFDTIIEDEKLIEAYRYLAYKTFSISKKYPNYYKYTNSAPREFNSDCPNAKKLEIKELVNKIKSDTSHTTLKIRQTLKFIDYITIHGGNKDFNQLKEDYIEYKPSDNSIFNGLTDFDKLIANFPPPFYKITIRLKTLKNEYITFEKMSSGERQFLFYMSTLLYHLKNLDSVIEGDESVHYKYVNIILEEVELYFHPEYQRQFVSKLIKYLEACRFSEIEYINVIIATHSPFILSDIPQDNIMFLDKGRQVNDKVVMPTFGANIHDMLRHSFFLEQGLIGDFAKEQIKKVLAFLENGTNQEGWTHVKAQQIINLIGEPLIKDRLQAIYNERYEINEIQRLKNRIKELEVQKTIK